MSLTHPPSPCSEISAPAAISFRDTFPLPCPRLRSGPPKPDIRPARGQPSETSSRAGTKKRLEENPQALKESNPVNPDAYSVWPVMLQVGLASTCVKA